MRRMQWSGVAVMMMCAGEGLAAQQVMERSSRWEHAMSVGALATPTITNGYREPPLGAIVQLDARRLRAGKRVAFASSLQLSAKGRGLLSNVAPGRSSTYGIRNDMASLTIGPDIALTTGRNMWTVGLGAGPAASRIVYRLRDMQPNMLRGGPPSNHGWSYTGVVLARTHFTVPASPQLSLRFGAQALSGMEAMTEDFQPILSGTVGIVLRR